MRSLLAMPLLLVALSAASAVSTPAEAEPVRQVAPAPELALVDTVSIERLELAYVRLESIDSIAVDSVISGAPAVLASRQVSPAPVARACSDAPALRLVHVPNAVHRSRLLALPAHSVTSRNYFRDAQPRWRSAVAMSDSVRSPLVLSGT